VWEKPGPPPLDHSRRASPDDHQLDHGDLPSPRPALGRLTRLSSKPSFRPLTGPTPVPESRPNRGHLSPPSHRHRRVSTPPSALAKPAGTGQLSPTAVDHMGRPESWHVKLGEIAWVPAGAEPEPRQAITGHVVRRLLLAPRTYPSQACIRPHGHRRPRMCRRGAAGSSTRGGQPSAQRDARAGSNGSGRVLVEGLLRSRGCRSTPPGCLLRVPTRRRGVRPFMSLRR
jgi:hypothetical protein